MNTQAKVALDKQAHPEKYCRMAGCLWRLTKRVPGTDYWIPSPCKRHPVKESQQ